MKKWILCLLMALMAPAAFACGKVLNNSYPAVLGKIYSVIDTTGLTGRQSVFLKFGQGLEEINRLTDSDATVASDSTTKEPVYGSLAEAIAAKDQGTKFIIELAVAPGLRQGHIINVHDMSGKPMQAAARMRCIGSQTYFRAE